LDLNIKELTDIAEDVARMLFIIKRKDVLHVDLGLGLR
jgi:hypothetical protein